MPMWPQIARAGLLPLIITGAALGTVVCVLCAAAAALLAIRRRKRQQRQDAEEEDAASAANPQQNGQRRRQQQPSADGGEQPAAQPPLRMRGAAATAAAAGDGPGGLDPGGVLCILPPAGFSQHVAPGRAAATAAAATARGRRVSAWSSTGAVDRGGPRAAAQAADRIHDAVPKRASSPVVGFAEATAAAPLGAAGGGGAAYSATRATSASILPAGGAAWALALPADGRQPQQQQQQLRVSSPLSSPRSPASWPDELPLSPMVAVAAAQPRATAASALLSAAGPSAVASSLSKAGISSNRSGMMLQHNLMFEDEARDRALLAFATAAAREAAVARAVSASAHASQTSSFKSAVSHHGGGATPAAAAEGGGGTSPGSRTGSPLTRAAIVCNPQWHGKRVLQPSVAAVGVSSSQGAVALRAVHGGPPSTADGPEGPPPWLARWHRQQGAPAAAAGGAGNSGPRARVTWDGGPPHSGGASSPLVVSSPRARRGAAVVAAAPSSSSSANGMLQLASQAGLGQAGVKDGSSSTAATASGTAAAVLGSGSGSAGGSSKGSRNAARHASSTGGSRFLASNLSARIMRVFRGPAAATASMDAAADVGAGIGASAHPRPAGASPLPVAWGGAADGTSGIMIPALRSAPAAVDMAMQPAAATQPSAWAMGSSGLGAQGRRAQSRRQLSDRPRYPTLDSQATAAASASAGAVASRQAAAVARSRVQLQLPPYRPAAWGLLAYAPEAAAAGGLEGGDGTRSLTVGGAPRAAAAAGEVRPPGSADLVSPRVGPRRPPRVRRASTTLGLMAPPAPPAAVAATAVAAEFTNGGGASGTGRCQ